MKQLLKAGIFALVLCLTQIGASAQQSNEHIPKWVSEQGYWVIEGNVNAPLNHVIRFYNNDDVQVYKESLTGVKLNINKRKVKMKLKKVLESAILAWENKQEKTEDMALVKHIL